MNPAYSLKNINTRSGNAFLITSILLLFHPKL